MRLSPARCDQSAPPRTSLFPVHSAHGPGNVQTREARSQLSRCGYSIKENCRTDCLNGAADSPPTDFALEGTQCQAMSGRIKQEQRSILESKLNWTKEERGCGEPGRPWAALRGCQKLVGARATLSGHHRWQHHLGRSSNSRSCNRYVCSSVTGRSNLVASL